MRVRLTMRWILWLLMLGLPGAQGHAATPITVEQLRQYLTGPHALKMRDGEVAERLGAVTLSEQLTGRTLADLFATTPMGPQTRDQLSLLAAASIWRDPPKAEQPDFPAPDADLQKQWIDAVVSFANGYLQHLPDFLATRVTQSFDNMPQAAKQKHAPRIALHPVGATHRAIAYRNGHEEVDAAAAEAAAGASATTEGSNLSSWGEFGPVLTTVPGDAFAGSVQFAHWDAGTSGNRIAVLHFSVPRSGSHYLVDFCCYRTDEDSGWMRFRDTPGYHGDITFDPNAGQIRRLSVEADLQSSDAVEASGIAVEYGQVQIGGRAYTCPVKSTAILVAHDFEMKKVDGVGLVTHLNETSFLSYRKFGSTTRILSAVHDSER